MYYPLFCFANAFFNFSFSIHTTSSQASITCLETAIALDIEHQNFF